MVYLYVKISVLSRNNISSKLANYANYDRNIYSYGFNSYSYGK